MADFTPPVIEAETPTVVPASEEASYDQYRLIRLTINAADPTRPIVARATLQKARTVNGVQELSPVDMPVTVSIDDVNAAAATDSGLATLYAGILSAVSALARAKGAI